MSLLDDKTARSNSPTVKQQAAMSSPTTDSDSSGASWSLNRIKSLFSGRGQLQQVAATIATTLAVFGIFMVQGVLIARVLGPLGRGEFGTALFFPRDILLYVGLLGGIEIVNRYASMKTIDSNHLRRAAARLGMFSGILTAVVGGLVSVIVLTVVDGGAKAYLIPYCLLICLFIPWEHMHLTVSGVDRGLEAYPRYNFNRLFFAAAFPILVVGLFVTGAHKLLGDYLLLTICVLFVVSKIAGMIPTFRGIPFRQWLAAPPEKSDVPTAGKLLREGRPYAISLAATEMFERLDILLILALATIEESGFYFVAVPAAALLTIAPNALGIFTFNAGAENRPVTVKTALGVLAGLAVFQIIATLVLAQIVPDLIVFFYGGEYAPSIIFAQYLLPACAIKGFLQAADGYLKGCGKPMIGVVARFLSIFVMLAFVYFAHQRFGLVSIPMAACVGQALSMIIITTFVVLEVRRRNRPELQEAS